MQMSITGLVVTIFVIVLGIYDLILVVSKSEKASVSNFLIRANLARPFIATAFGFVLGHLFGVMYPEACPPVTASILAPNFYMITTGVLAVSYFFLWRKKC